MMFVFWESGFQNENFGFMKFVKSWEKVVLSDFVENKWKYAKISDFQNSEFSIFLVEKSRFVKSQIFSLLTIELTAHNGDLERDEEAFDEVLAVQTRVRFRAVVE